LRRLDLQLQRQYFGGHPLAIDACGTPETLAKIQPSDLAALHQSLVVADNIVIGVSGAFDRPTVMEFVSRRFGSLPKLKH
jgi:zinc protease